jgi:hypothetical protein
MRPVDREVIGQAFVNGFLGLLVRLARRLLTGKASGVMIGRELAASLAPMVVFTT